MLVRWMSETSEREQCKVSREDFNWIVLDIVCFDLPPPTLGGQRVRINACTSTHGRTQTAAKKHRGEAETQWELQQSDSSTGKYSAMYKKKEEEYELLLGYCVHSNSPPRCPWNNSDRTKQSASTLREGRRVPRLGGDDSRSAQSASRSSPGWKVLPRAVGCHTGHRARRLVRPASDLIAPGARLRVPARPQVTSVLISVSSRPTGDLAAAYQRPAGASVAMADQDRSGEKKKTGNKFNIQCCSRHQKHWKLVEELYRFAIDGTNCSNLPRWYHSWWTSRSLEFYSICILRFFFCILRIFFLYSFTVIFSTNPVAPLHFWFCLLLFF